MIERPNIVAVFEFYGLRITTPDRGGWRKALCPRLEHQETNPSASINEDEGKWFCHACNEGGDGLDIIAEREGLDFKAAQQFASKFEGNEVDNNDRGSSLLPRRAKSQGSWKAPWSSL